MPPSPFEKKRGQPSPVWTAFPPPGSFSQQEDSDVGTERRAAAASEGAAAAEDGALFGHALCPGECRPPKFSMGEPDEKIPFSGPKTYASLSKAA